MSGTRRGMSSNPASYASSYGTKWIGESLPVMALTRSARSPIEISPVLPMLNTSPMARGFAASAISASTTSPT